MDFVNRSQQARTAASNGVHVAGAGSAPEPEPKRRDRTGRVGGGSKWARLGSVLLAVLVAALVIALIVMFVWGPNNQSKYINKDDYQAVFINVNGTTGGQVYFGHIKNITDQYVDLTNVFYIQNQASGSSSTSSNSYTLVKLGCELHGPTDQMIVNNSQVYFWENLKPSGQVSQKIADYYKQNPNGQNCSQSSTNGSATQSSTNTQSSSNSTNSSATTTPTTTTGTTKP
jgi:hypothetical protein